MTSTVKYDEIEFVSGGATCHAWHFTGEGAAFDREAGRPIVVMAHGLAGTKDSGLQPFAESLAGAGLDVLAFDYRGFGASGGAPRQTVSMTGQLEDYRAAMATAARLPGVDGHRLVLWGVSLAGGHVIAAAAGREDVAAVVAVTPLVDGIAAGRHALSFHKPTAMLRSTVVGLQSKVGGPRMMPVVAPPGELGCLTLDGCMESYLAIAGPTWRNEIDATVGLELGSHRPGRLAGDVRAPMLVQIADFDRSAPPQAAAKAAFAARAQVRHYPCDHFDVYAGRQWHDSVVAHQVAFLRQALAAA